MHRDDQGVLASGRQPLGQTHGTALQCRCTRYFSLFCGTRREWIWMLCLRWRYLQRPRQGLDTITIVTSRQVFAACTEKVADSFRAATSLCYGFDGMGIAHDRKPRV